MKKKRVRWIAAVSVSAALVLTGCAGGGGGASPAGGGASLGTDATKEAFTEALSTMSETTIIMQPMAPSPNSSTGPAYVQFAKSIEEWSGGKIKVELNFGWPIAPLTETDQAIRDGRINYGVTLPLYQPTEYPGLGDLMMQASVLLPTGPYQYTLGGMGAMEELVWESPKLIAELDDFVVMNGGFFGQSAQGIACREPAKSAADFSSLTIAGNGKIQLAQLEALGATPVSMPFNETYEALERGVVDCGFASSPAILAGGWLEVAPNVTVFDKAALATGPEVFLFNRQVWESLPLAGRQLIWDKMTEFFVFRAQVLLNETLPGLVAASEKNGGRISYPDDGVQAGLAEYNASLIAAWDNNKSAGSGFQTKLEGLIQKWVTQVEKAGYVEQGDLSDFTKWHKPGSLDMQPFRELVVEMRSKYRPSE